LQVDFLESFGIIKPDLKLWRYPMRFFILSEEVRRPSRYELRHGIVVAEDVNEAARKLGTEVESVITNPGREHDAYLRGGLFALTEIPEITTLPVVS